MAQNYDLKQTGPELQARIDQVYPNRDAIEQETETREAQDESLETSLKEYTDTEQARAEAAEGALDTRVSANEVDIDLLKSQYEALTQSDIIVGPLPSTGQPNKIYRVPGSTYYTDYMWANGGWVKLAEYSTLDGYVYKGIATPSGTPVQSAEAIFYFAVEPGTYTNYGGLVVTNTIAILKFNGTDWTKDDLIAIDNEPTAGSENLVTSGAVAASVVYDISAANAVGGQLATYADLAAALDGGTNVPVDVRKGGMEIKFVQSSDNKYVQYRLMADEWSTIVADWQGVDDEPTAGSENLVKSGGVVRSEGEIKRMIGIYDIPMDFDRDRFICYMYGGFKGGDTIKIKAVGTAATQENSILCRYDDDSQFANLTNNGAERAVTLTKDSTYLYFVVTESNIITPGTINIISSSGLSDLVEENSKEINNLEFSKYSKYYICETSGNEAVKIIAYGDNVVLDTHFDCVVRFANRNTASNVKIKLGNNEAVDVTLNGNLISEANSWDAWQYLRLIYNGSQFVLFPYTDDLNKKIKQGTVLLNKTIGNWVGGSFATNTNKFQTSYDVLAERRVTSDFVAVDKGAIYISNKTLWIQQYNKNYGFLEAGSVAPNSQIKFSNETAFIKCDIDTEENLNDLLIKLYKDFIPTDEYDKEYTEECYDFNGSINAKVTNGKIRVFAEFTIDEDINVGSGGFRTLLTIGRQNRKMYLGAIQNSTVPLKTWINGLERYRDLDVDFGVPDFKSAFAWYGPVAGRVTYPLRTYPAWKPICGKPYIGVRYKGVVNSTVDENNITTNITSVKMITINPEFVIFRGIVGQSNVTLDRNISLTESMTVKDLVNAINSDQVLSDYLEAFVYSNEKEKVRDNLVKCSGVELVTTMPNANEDPSKGTRSICCPAYLFGKIDKTTHTIEIVSDGINARIVFDGQNDGSFFAGNINSSNGMLSSMLNYDLIPVLREDTIIDFSSSEIKATFKYVRVDVNYTGDAECAEYGRVISNYNPNRIVLMGHPMFDGEEIDGGHPTSAVNTKGYSISQADLPEFWRADNISNNPDAIVVSESNIVTSTGRMKHFAQYTKDHGYKWLSPDDMLSSKNKRQITILFDDWRINIFYNPLLKHGFIDGCKGNFAIESMFKFVTDDETRKKLAALHINGWNCYIHGCADETTVGYDTPQRYAEKIYKMTYEQLYDLSGVLNYSVGKQRTEATIYGLNSRVWIYANGGQTVAGLFPVARYGYELGLMTDFDQSVYWCDAANPLYVKRFESCDRNYFKFFELQAFAEKAPYAIHPLTEHAVIESSSSLYTHLLRWYCYYCTGFPILEAGVVFSSVNTEPTLDGSDCEISRAMNQSFPMAVYTPPSQGRVDYFYQSRVVLEQGNTYYWRGWCKTANGLSYTDVYEFEYE